MLISVVGKSGSGKSTIVEKLKGLNKNIISLDIDRVGHYINEMDSVKESLIKNFGNEIISEGKINRKALGSLVFNSEEKMHLLTEITYPKIEEEIENFISSNQNKIVILDWLLLPKTKFFHQSDLKILVKSPFKVRKIRIMERDNITEEKVLERERASIEFNETDFDYIIDNSIENESEVRKIYEKSIICG